MNAILVTLEALAEPVFAIAGGIALTAITYWACQTIKRLIRWAWPRE